MTTLSDLNNKRIKLINQVATLQSSVTHGDKSVSYDLAHAKEALMIIDKEIARLNGSPVTRRVTIVGSKGF